MGKTIGSKKKRGRKDSIKRKVNSFGFHQKASGPCCGGYICLLSLFVVLVAEMVVGVEVELVVEILLVVVQMILVAVEVVVVVIEMVVMAIVYKSIMVNGGSGMEVVIVVEILVNMLAIHIKL